MTLIFDWGGGRRGGGGVIRCWSLLWFEGSLQWSQTKIFLELTKFMQLDLLKCLSWFPCFPNLDEKVPEWSNIFIQWLCQWKIWAKFLKIHIGWRLIWLWALNRVWLKIAYNEYKSSIQNIFIYPNYKTTQKMKYSLLPELLPVCTVHQLIMIGKMELIRKTNPPEC